jgi:hypothetical protein
LSDAALVAIARREVGFMVRPFMSG